MMKVLVVFGTRPEAIKMAPVIKALTERSDVETVTCSTGQHRSMLSGVLDFFGLRADHDLAIMRPDQDLTYVTAAVLNGLKKVIAAEKPDWLLVHGDTTTAMAATLAGFYAGCRVGHVEAGLRTRDMQRPWPEEMNRSVIDRVADALFAPTEAARANLRAENIADDKIVVTGNTVIDALLTVRAAIEGDAALRHRIGRWFDYLSPDKRLVLVTGHRRESFGAGFEGICKALRQVADRRDVEILYPVHLNPAVQEPVRRLLGGLANVHLVKPLDYVPFVYLMMRSHLILTDSGGIQEEAPSLGKPVLVMRDVTERPEAVEAGTVALVGANQARIFAAATKLLDCPDAYAGFARAHNPYGDGSASRRISDFLCASAAA
ncbi:MAG: UDP-N-acetylglucosamine 2-epimerase (non-hydrolyzing) [Alphaproteobacteria bacterium]|nr:UDP-N-acetylglucosamine 2-epimerase (non-hydrolyzing) [Alphaproteobacteria bacterium]